jgi:hypothetical protein
MTRDRAPNALEQSIHVARAADEGLLCACAVRPPRPRPSVGLGQVGTDSLAVSSTVRGQRTDTSETTRTTSCDAFISACNKPSQPPRGPCRRHRASVFVWKIGNDPTPPRERRTSWTGARSRRPRTVCTLRRHASPEVVVRFPSHYPYRFRPMRLGRGAGSSGRRQTHSSSSPRSRIRVSSPWSCAWSTISPTSSVRPARRTGTIPSKAVARRSLKVPRMVIRIRRAGVTALRRLVHWFHGAPTILGAWVMPHHPARGPPRAIFSRLGPS